MIKDKFNAKWIAVAVGVVAAAVIARAFWETRESALRRMDGYDEDTP